MRHFRARSRILSLRKRRMHIIQVRDGAPASDCRNPEQTFQKGHPRLCRLFKIITVRVRLHFWSLIETQRRMLMRIL